jgi:hypothetical protein
LYQAWICSRHYTPCLLPLFSMLAWHTYHDTSAEAAVMVHSSMPPPNCLLHLHLSPVIPVPNTMYNTSTTSSSSSSSSSSVAPGLLLLPPCQLLHLPVED